MAPPVLLSYCNIFNMPRPWDEPKSHSKLISVHPEVQVMPPSPLVYHILVSADRMQQQPPPRSVSHLGTHFPLLTLTPHQSCYLIGWTPHSWPLIGCSQVPADLWVMQSFLSPNTINSSRTAPFRCMVDQWCTQAKFLFTFLILYLNHSSLSIGDLQMPW